MKKLETSPPSPSLTKLEDVHLAVVTPMANEIESALKFVTAVLEEAEKFPFKNITVFTVLDKISTDGTIEILQDFARIETRLKVVYAPENRCVVDAYMKGYAAAIHARCDWILEIDAGFSHDPRSLTNFVREMQSGCDIVYATRFTKGGSIVDSSFKRRCISRFGGMVSGFLLGSPLGDLTSGYILYSRHALERVLAKGIQSKGPFFQTEMKYHARGMLFREVPITYRGASHNVGNKALIDARTHLIRLFRERLKARK